MWTDRRCDLGLPGILLAWPAWGSVCHVHRSRGDSGLEICLVPKHVLVGFVCHLTPSAGCHPLGPPVPLTSFPSIRHGLWGHPDLGWNLTAPSPAL